MIVFTVLLLVATSISVGVYWYTRQTEYDDFVTNFNDYSRNILSTFQTNAHQRLLAIESLATTMTSYAQSQKNTTWPFVTLPNYELRVTQTIDLASVLSCVVLPIVNTPQEKEAWETYSVENDGWFQEGLEIQALQKQLKETGANTTDDDESENESLKLLGDIRNSTGSGISPQVFRLVGTGSEVETGPGPYLPWWYVRCV